MIKLSLFILIITTFGCQKATRITVEVHDNTLSFNFPLQSKKHQIALQDFQVIKSDCIKNCTVWFLVGSENKNSEPNYATLSGNTLLYGNVPKWLKERVKSKPLEAGKYSVTVADASGGGFAISGSKRTVLNGAAADYLILTALAEPGDPRSLSLFLLPAHQPGLRREPFVAVDGSHGAHARPM